MMDERYKLIIDGGTENAFTKEYTREELESKKDYIDKTYGGRYKVETIGDADTSAIDDAASYTVRFDGSDFTKTYTGADFKAKKDYLDQNYGGRYHVTTTLGSYDNMRDLFPSLGERLDTFRMENRDFMNDIEARREAAIEASKSQEAMRPDSMKTSSYTPISTEEWNTYSELAKQEEALKKAYYTSDEYLLSKSQKAYQLSQMQKQLQADMDLYASENPMIIGGAAFVPNPAVAGSRGLQQDEEMQNYDTARRILNETIKLQNAPSKYDASTGIRNMAIGAGDELTNAALWTAGLSEIADNLNVRGVLDKVQKELGSLSDLSEEKIESVLTPAEKAVLQAWAINAQTQLERAADLSRGYQAGKGAVESLGFMAEFALTGGVGKATAEGAETFAKWLGKKLFSASDEVAGKVAKEVAEEAGEGILKKYTKNLGLSLAEAAGRTGVMPSTFRNISERALELEQGEDGELRLVQMNKAFVKGLSDSFIENLSEGGRVNAIGGLVGDTLNKIPKWNQFTDWLTHTKVGNLYTALQSSGIMNTLRAGGWHGIGEEYLEEWYGNAIRTITGVDKDALREFATKDNQLVTIASFLPLTIFGGTVSTGQVLSAKKRLEASSAAWKSALMERAYDEKQAKQSLDMLMMSSPAEIGKIIDSLVAKEAETNLSAAAKLARAGADLQKSIIKWQAFDTKYKAQEADQRKAVRDRLSQAMPGKKWWMTDEKGKETVMRATNANGDVIFVTGKPSAPGQKSAGVRADGEVVFFNADDYQMESEVSMDTFLGNEVMAEKADKEKARMLAEKDAAIAVIKKSAVPGASVVLGTAEVPIPGTIVKRYVDGVAIETAEGVVMMTYEQLGNYVGENAIPLTDDQIDNQEADVILAKDAQREAELDAEYGGLDSAEKNEEEAIGDAKAAIETEESIPVDSEGNVDEQALWNEDPSKWAVWNDEQRQDGGANSMLAVNAAMASLSAQIAEAETAYAAMPVGPERNALEQDINAKKARLQELNDIVQSYAVQAEAAAVEQQLQASATSQMSDQEKEQMDEQYESIYGQTRSLNEKARLLQEYLDKVAEGTVPVVVLTEVNYAQMMANEGCPESAIKDVEKAIKDGAIIEGFMVAGKTFVFADNIPTIDRGRQKYVHERQHVLTSNSDYVRRVLATGVTREQLRDYLRILSQGKFYDRYSINVMADEFLSFALELVYTYEDFSVSLQNIGVSDAIINVIKSIDDEQSRTNGERLSQARRRRGLHPHVSATYAEHGGQNARNLEQVSSGLLGQQDAGSPAYSARGTGDREGGEGAGEQVNPAFVEAISTTEQDAEFSQLIDEKAFEDPKPIDGIESDDVRYSILKEEEMRKSTQAYYDKHYKGGKLSASDKKRVPLDLTHFTQELLDAANAQIQELWEHMRPYLDMESKGKRFLPAEVYGKSTLFDNASYGKTMENTLICTRTLAYIDFVEEVKKRIGRPLTATESFLASQMLYDIAIDPQCLYCYVSLDRKAYDEFLLKYAQQRDEVIAKWNESDKSEEAKENLYKEFLNGRKPTAQMQARFESWLLLADGGATTLEDLATKARRSEIKIGEIPEAWVKASAKYKKLKKDKKLAYAASEEYQTALWGYLASPAGQVTDAEAYAQSASWAKKEEDYRSYTGELLKCSADALRGLMGHYGLRFYSFSEYSPAFILENMQMVRDAAARGLKGFAYTKEIDFIKIFAPTGMNINCSVYGRVDSEGNVVPDTKQGADWAQVQALREQYPNVGAVFVATNDEMVEWALNQPWIDVIIPFHIVRTGADIAKFYDWTNYSSMQSDTTNEGKSGYVYPHEHLNDKETFLRITAERGWRPRFAEVKLSDGRSVVEHPNYMRLVNETRRRADETPILTPTFNTEEAKESFDAFVEKGGYYGGYFVEEGAFEQGVETVVEDIKAGKTAKEVDYGRQDVPIDVAKIMARRAELERKHGKSSAVETKDLIEAAKASLEEEKVSFSAYTPHEASLDEIDEMFKEYNADQDLAALYDRVSALAHTMGLKVRFAESWGKPAGSAFVDKVKYNVDYFNDLTVYPQEKAQALLHELIHTMTSYALFMKKGDWLTPQMKEAAMKLENIYESIKDDPDFKGMRAVNDAHEMVAELSNLKFRSKLREKSLLDKILDAIKQFLGIEVGENALDNLSATFDYMMENFDSSAYEALRQAAQNNEDYVRFSVANESQAIFVSNAAKAVEAIKMEKATPAQWLAMIEKNGGLKAGEDKWMGLSDWLKESDKKTLTKAEVLDFIGEHMIQIEETHYDAYAEEKVADAYAEMGRILQDKFNDYREEYYEQNEDEDLYGNPANDYAIQRLREEFGDEFPYAIEVTGAGDVYFTFPYEEDEDMRKWSDKLGVEYNPQAQIENIRLGYTTDGLTNKHEIALTVPTIEPWGMSDMTHFGDAGEGRAVAWVRFGETEIPTAEYKLLLDEMDRLKEVARELYEEFGGRSNELAEVEARQEELRLEMRSYKNAGYKVLVIDEIQSKRHQEGREKGYRSKDYWKRRTDYLAARTMHDGLYDEMKAKYGDDWINADTEGDVKRLVTEEEFARLVKANEEFDAAADAYKGLVNAIPDAPFDKNWHELAMKRMLRYAAENGYDYIAWTKGEQQAERYDIGGVVSEISVKHAGPSGYEVESFNGSGNSVLYGVYPDVSAIAEVYGKELAERITDSVSSYGDKATIDGNNLKVGGEGMKGFYDKMLPAFMNKYGKKWGVKVEDIELPNLEEAGRVMHSVPVTEEMKASVMEGQVMFSAVSITPEVREEMDRIAANAIIDGNYMLAPNGQPTKLNADQWALVRTQNFINWFGDWINDPENASKVVDENGEPKVAYHQTNVKIYINRETGQNWGELGWKEKMEWDERDDWDEYWEEQDFNTFSRVNARTTNEFDGFFFAPEYDEYHEYGERTIPAFLNIKNPASRADYNIDASKNDAGRDERIRLQEAGFDGVIRMEGDEVDEYIAFEPNQIKSAVETTGEFSESEDIRFSAIKTFDDIPDDWTDSEIQGKEAKRMQMSDVADEYFTNYVGSVIIPAPNKSLAEKIGSGNKEVLIKRGVFAKMAIGHSFTPSQSRDILSSSLYSPNLYGQSQKTTRPLNWVIIKTGVKNAATIIEVNETKDFLEVVSWYTLDERNLKRIERQAKREGGEILILDSEESLAASLSALPSDLSSESKVTNNYDSASESEEKVVADSNEASGIRFSVRTNPAPVKTKDVYKLMRLGEDGKLYPLFIGSAEAIELGIWYDADSPNLGDLTKLATGIHLVNNETGEAMTLEQFKAEHPEISVKGKRPNVEAINWATANGMRWIEIEDKAEGQKRYGGEARSYFNLGINGSGQVGQFAMRPGWHAGSLPTMRQIGKGSDKYLRDDSFVWVKGRVPADIDYQAEADANPDKDIPTHIPVDGYYMKATNANAAASQADRVGWYVAGSFIADEIISDEEARRVITEWNENHRDAQVKYDFRREGGMDFVPGVGMVETTLAPAKRAEDVVEEGLGLSDQEFARLAGNIFAALPASWKKGVTDSLGNILELQEKIMQAVTRLAEKESWTKAEKDVAKDIRNSLMDILDPSGIDIDRPLTPQEALWMLYNALEKSTDIVSEAKRSVVAHNLGFDIDTLAKEAEAKEEVRFSARRNAKAEATARLYNKAATNVWARLKETFVDMFASVEDLVKAIEKVSGKVAEGFENIIMALNQQSSRGFAAMEKYEREYLDPMFDEIDAIMNSTGMTYDEVVRYVILKHGLERNVVFAKRDAREFYEDEFRQKVASIRANESLTEQEKKAQEAEAEKELDQHITDIEWGIDEKFKELREKDYSGITSMFYDQLDVKREYYETEEDYQSAIVRARKHKFDNLADVEAAAANEVRRFEGMVNTDNLWKAINAGTKEILRQQYEASMISKESYDKLKDMFKYYVPLRGFKDNTAEDMYTYYQSPNSTGYTKPILAAEGRSTEAESPFGWIASMASSAIASNVKNEARLALYYFVVNRPDNGLATVSKTWYVHTPGDVTAEGKKVFRPSYPPLTPDMTTQEAKEATAKWMQSMEAARALGNAYESGKKLNLGDTVVNISDASVPEHAVKVKVGGKDYVIFINGNPRAAQAINGNLNIEADEDYSKVFGKVLRWMSSVNTSYNPEFWVTNMQRDMLFTMMAISVKEDKEYRRRFAANYARAFKVIKMAAQHENGTIGDAYLEEMYRQFVENGGVTGYTQIKDNEIWEQEIADYMKSKDKERQKMGKAMRKAKDGLHAIHRFGESLEQVSRFAAFLTSREMGKSMAEAISDAKEITVNFNRKGSGRRISPSEAKTLTDKNGQPLNRFEQFLVSAISYMSPIGRSSIMFFNAAIQGLNATYRLYKANPAKMIGVWSLGYMTVGVMNALLHGLMDDDDDYLDMPQYERRTSLMLGANGFYFKWAIPQEAKVFYALGDIIVEQALGRNPQKWYQEGSALREAVREITGVSPVNPLEGWRGLLPSILVPVVELIVNEDYKGQPIYRESKWMSDEENERTARWSRAYEGTGMAYVGISKLFNNLTGGDARDAGIINIPPETMEHIVQSSFGGTVRTLDKFVTSIVAALDQEVSEQDEPYTLRQTPFLNRLFVLNDERFRNAHVNDMYDYYKAEAEHVKKLEKGYREDKDMSKLSELKRSEEYRWVRVYDRYRKPIEKKREQVYEAKSGKERQRLQGELDALKKRMIRDISQQ